MILILEIILTTLISLILTQIIIQEMNKNNKIQKIIKKIKVIKIIKRQMMMR